MGGGSQCRGCQGGAGDAGEGGEGLPTTVLKKTAKYILGGIPH